MTPQVPQRRRWRRRRRRRQSQRQKIITTASRSWGRLQSRFGLCSSINCFAQNPHHLDNHAATPSPRARKEPARTSTSTKHKHTHTHTHTHADADAVVPIGHSQRAHELTGTPLPTLAILDDNPLLSSEHQRAADEKRLLEGQPSHSSPPAKNFPESHLFYSPMCRPSFLLSIGHCSTLFRS
jgi:hypothetical protein